MLNLPTKTYWKIGGAVFLLYLAIHYWENISGLAILILQAAAPLLFGLAAAYVINILMKFYERLFLPKSKSGTVKKIRRPLCLLLAILSLAAIIILVTVMIVPELVSCLKTLFALLPQALESIYTFLDDKFNISAVLSESTISIMNGSFNFSSQFDKALEGLLNGVGGAMSSITSVLSSVFSATVTFIVGIVFSIYLLLGKERLTRQVNGLLSTYLKPKYYERFCYVAYNLHKSFSKFIVGQCTEAVILGALCILGMSIFRFPYATMIGTLIGFTALIPVAGAYIGAIVGAVMIFTVSPVKALLFLVFLVILQQLEGNLIYPKVVGSSIGLPGIWVLAAVTIGGGVLGVGGMLLGVPIAAAVYHMLKEDVAKRNVLPQKIDENTENT